MKRMPVVVVVAILLSSCAVAGDCPDDVAPCNDTPGWFMGFFVDPATFLPALLLLLVVAAMVVWLLSRSDRGHDDAE